jgi:hypothetical protein
MDEELGDQTEGNMKGKMLSGEEELGIGVEDGWSSSVNESEPNLIDFQIF